jgi:hypothetical protein
LHNLNNIITPVLQLYVVHFAKSLVHMPYRNKGTLPPATEALLREVFIPMWAKHLKEAGYERYQDLRGKSCKEGTCRCAEWGYSCEFRRVQQASFLNRILKRHNLKTRPAQGEAGGVDRAQALEDIKAHVSS